MQEKPASLLELQVRTQNEVRVIEGQLYCAQCQSLFPILKGVPILVPDVDTYLTNSILHALTDHNESPFIEQWLTESTGPTSAYTLTRQYISTYAEAHYGQHKDPPLEPKSGFEQLADLASSTCHHSALAIDIGCSVGGSTSVLAQKTDNLVLGIDVSLGMIRFAQQALQGRVRYGKRRVGTVYDPVEYEIPNDNAERIDFWVADALSLPFLKQTVNHSQSIHLLDCVSTPTKHLTELIRILQDDGTWGIVCPYDWSLGATDYHKWLGGFGYFQGHNGQPEAVLKWLMSSESPHPELQQTQLINEIQQQTWRLPIHARSTMHYQSHVLLGRVNRV